MQGYIITLILIWSSSAVAGLTPKREKLFDCAHLKDNSPVERVYIHKSHFGNNDPFYELEIVVHQEGLTSSYFEKVNLIKIYDGKILHFTKGNTRIKIDLVRKKEEKYFTFARIPKYNIHSFDWVCKKLYE